MKENLRPDTQPLAKEAILLDTRAGLGRTESPGLHGTVLIPTRVRKAGRLFHELRTRNGTAADLVTHALPAQYKKTFRDFEAGDASIPLPHIYRVGTQLFYEEEPEMQKIKNMIEEERWMKTLTKGTFKDEGITLGRAVTILRLSNLQTKKAFFTDAQISQVQLSKLERDNVVPTQYLLTDIIETAGLPSLSIPAQQIRLLRQKRDPMTLAELQDCTFGELFSYLRQLKGLSGRDVEKKRDKSLSRGVVSAIEHGRFQPSRDMQGKLLPTLALDPRSALSKVIHLKAECPTERIPDTMVQEVFTGEHDGLYLFSENLQEFDVNTLLEELGESTQSLIGADQPNKGVGSLLKHLREKATMGPRELARHAKMSHGDISRIERGEYVPQDITIMRLLVGLGYDIHDPVTWYLLDIAEMAERRYK